MRRAKKGMSRRRRGGEKEKEGDEKEEGKEWPVGEVGGGEGRRGEGGMGKEGE